MASGNFGSGGQSKRQLAAEVASLLALSAIRNGDKVGLLLFTDRIEEYIPPGKGRRHVLRVVREILYRTPAGRGTDGIMALEYAGRILHRRAIVFMISDFQSSGDLTKARAALRQSLRQANRRHDVVAVRIEDARERELPNVGLVALQDAETGELIELDTGDAELRARFNVRARQSAADIAGDIRGEGIDLLELTTNAPYVPALQRFFKTRERHRR